MNIRSRTQSDVTATRRLMEKRLANQVRSKDEFDVARTLANFSETAINFTDSDRQSCSSDREKTLDNLSHDRNSVICKNPGSIHTNQSQDADMDTDDDVDVVGDDMTDDPLEDFDGYGDDNDNGMETDQFETIDTQVPSTSDLTYNLCHTLQNCH